mmetsp:Transcript_4610/g.6836  ORF Transcript_4610/g.6836 Transcript_4610/m.6836 type:complete len:89 (-) Transcript_4610:511-777(-)
MEQQKKSDNGGASPGLERTRCELLETPVTRPSVKKQQGLLCNCNHSFISSHLGRACSWISSAANNENIFTRERDISGKSCQSTLRATV